MLVYPKSTLDSYEGALGTPILLNFVNREVVED